MNQNQNQKFKALAASLGFTDEQIASRLGLTLASYRRMLQPSSKTPKWVVAVLMFDEGKT